MPSLTRSESHRSVRAKLRHASFIDPQTGVKSKRVFTLHDSDYMNGSTLLPGSSYSPLSAGPTHDHPQEARSRIERLKTSARERLSACRAFVTSDVGVGVFKFALAYLLSSMFTFIPFFSVLLGKYDSKHTAATVTVYFHPARSAGNMLEALILAFSAFLYAAAVSVSSMAVSDLFVDELHQVVLGHAIVLIVFVGGGLGVVGWIKLKKGNPLVNVACSLTSLSLIAILTSEGAVQAGDLSFGSIGQYLRMTVGGVISSVLVCFLVFPVSAQRQFKKNIVEVTDTLSDMLGLITSSFISGDEMELESKDYSTINDAHRKSLAKLNQNVRESKFELNFVGYEAEAKIQDRMLQCVRQIAQSIGGLRSAAAMQFVIIKQPYPMGSMSHTEVHDSYASMLTSPARTPNLERHHHVNGFNFDHAAGSVDSSTISFDNLVQKRVNKFRSPQQIFELFIDHLGPSMRSLAFTMKEILDDLPFDAEENYAISNNPRFRVSLERALTLYKEARTIALETVYDKKNMERDRPVEVEADWEEAAACCGHFSFCLLEVAEQLKLYLVTLDDLGAELESRPGSRSWSWLKFWKKRTDGDMGANTDEPDLTRGVKSRLADNYEIQNMNPKPNSRDRREDEETLPAKVKARAARKVYDALSFLRREDKKYAIKVGFGALLYALPSYVAVTRPIYTHWRGEWGLLSYMLVCSMTIGASNTTGYQRFLGTCLGAVLAVAAWRISQEHPVPLAFFGFCMAYWGGYIIVAKGKGPMGRFIMLSYNLSALFAYNLLMTHDSNDSDEEDGTQSPKIYTIALHRVVAVLSGCVWGLIITRVVWPISARQKLRDGLSLLWLRMGLIWKRDPLSTYTHGDSPNNYMNLREETEFQRFLSQLQKLVDAAKQEFEFRRAFPDIVFSRMLKSTARMLDAFHTMQVVILKDPNISKGEAALLQATKAERAQLCSRISHQFSVLASSVKLEYSIATDAMPNTEHTRDRLLAKIFAFRKADVFEKDADDEDYSVLYTYALVTGQIGVEIHNCLKEIESLFGVLDEEALWLQ